MAEQNWTTVVTKSKKSRTKTSFKELDTHSQKKPGETSRSFEGAAVSGDENKLNQNFKLKGKTPFSGKDNASNPNMETVKAASGASLGNKNEAETKFGARKNEVRNPTFQRDQQTVDYKAKQNLISALPSVSKAHSCSISSAVPSHHTQAQSNSKTIQKPEQTIVGESDLPKSKRKYKKRTNKEDRRKNREEKFYQALYQNKDSHIQFVSADVIRKLQNDIRPSSSSKPVQYPTKNLAHSGLAFPTLLSTNVQPQQSTPSTSKKCQIPTQTKQDPVTTVTPSITISSSNILQEPDPDIATENKPICQVFLPTHSSTTPVSDPHPLIASPVIQASSVTKKKKSKQPMVIDFDDLIVPKKIEKDPERKIRMESFKENYKITKGNMLDSSGPGIIHRGKIRQKKKKPTKLKLSILKSRALKRILLEENEKSIQQNKLNPSEQNVSRDTDTDDTIYVEVEHEVFNNPAKEDKDEMLKILNGNLLVKCEIQETENSSDLNTSENVDINVLGLETTIDKKFVKFESADTKYSDEVKFEDSKEVKIEKVDDIHSDGSEVKLLQLLDDITTAENTEKSIPDHVNIVVKNQLHNRKFRDYCDMFTSKELYVFVNRLLSELYRFQDRLYHNDPIKFKTKRRMVSGLKDAFSYLNLNKVQLLVIAPDIEKNPEPGGLDERVAQILLVAKSKNVPYVFSGNKYILGRPMRIKTPISIIAVLDKQNCEETFRQILDEATQLREKYDEEFLTKAKQYMDEHNECNNQSKIHTFEGPS